MGTRLSASKVGFRVAMKARDPSAKLAMLAPTSSMRWLWTSQVDLKIGSVRELVTIDMEETLPPGIHLILRPYLRSIQLWWVGESAL